jgi:hypothetical protein
MDGYLSMTLNGYFMFPHDSLERLSLIGYKDVFVQFKFNFKDNS